MGEAASPAVRKVSLGNGKATAAIRGVNSVASNSFAGRARAVLALGLVGSAIAMAVSAAPASARLGIACPSATSTPFAAWQDYANYAFAPDGGVEAGGPRGGLGGGGGAGSRGEVFFRYTHP